jgi:hypothetical protein
MFNRFSFQMFCFTIRPSQSIPDLVLLCGGFGRSVLMRMHFDVPEPDDPSRSPTIPSLKQRMVADFASRLQFIIGSEHRGNNGRVRVCELFTSGRYDFCGSSRFEIRFSSLFDHPTDTLAESFAGFAFTQSTQIAFHPLLFRALLTVAFAIRFFRIVRTGLLLPRHHSRTDLTFQ